jgi:signal transduction histidine kinase
VSIRIRLALFGVGIVTLTLVAFTLLFFALLTGGSANTQDRELAARADAAVAAIASAPAEDFTPRRSTAPVDAASALDMFTLVLDADGAPLYTGGVIDGVAPAISTDALSNTESASTVEAASGVPLRVQVRAWSRPDLGLDGYVVAAQSTGRVQQELRGGRAFVLVAAVFAFIVASVAIWLVIGRALRPLRQLATLTDEVGATQDLSRRLPVPRPRDEVRQLSESFNTMMERLQQANAQLAESLAMQQRFVADASHELRTPLTTIRSNAGFLLQRPDAVADDRDAALLDIASESERMSRLVHDLLTLARADAGAHLEREPADVTALVRDVCRQAAAQHPDRRIEAHIPDHSPQPAGTGGGGETRVGSLRAEPQAPSILSPAKEAESAAITLDANAGALTQLLWILIDNAARHTSAGGRIDVTLTRDEARFVLTVADDGEGIPEAHLERVFDRFYQADPARTAGKAGLGLAIARWIVEEHGGRITAHNNLSGGATLRVELPANNPADVPSPL